MAISGEPEQFRWNEEAKVYSKQFRSAKTSIGTKMNPDSRRHIECLNVADIDKMALPPCHSFFQFYVVNGYPDCQLYQRSADMALGVPFNIASYSLLLMMVAKECNLIPIFYSHIWRFAHFKNHVEGVQEQLQRIPGSLNVNIANKPFFEITLKTSCYQTTPTTIHQIPNRCLNDDKIKC